MTTLSELSASRELLSNLTSRELRGKYQRSALGWAWSMINPLATMLIFTVVFAVVLGVDPPESRGGELRNYALFLLCGLLPWSFLSNGMTGSMTSLIGNANLVKKVYFPREILIASTVFSHDFTLLIEMAVLAVAFLVVGNFVLPWLPLVLLLIALQTAFVVGVGLAFSVLNVYFRDVQHFVAILLQLWFYATPIIYPFERVADANREFLGVDLVTLYRLNPMVGFVESYRALLYHLELPSYGDLGYITAVSLGLLALGYALFRRLEPRLAEEL